MSLRERTPDGAPSQGHHRDYPSTAVYLTHPVRLRTWAGLFGLGGWTGAAFRVLELGCGNAANLLPLAASFPEAELVGVDRDGALIERGRSTAEAAGLHNVRLVEADLRDFELRGEAFDFVIAHGVYSWVSPDVQDRLLAIVGQSLSPFGVAYISYNTFPGWSVRGVVRDMMRDAAGAANTTAERLRAARARVAELQRSALQPDHPFSALLAAELEFVQEKADGYLLGEHLAERNEPVYFKEFVRRAGEHGLRYVCELIQATAEGGADFELPARLMRDGMSRIDAEQCLDVLTYRQFRASLLCREEVSVAPAPDFAQLAASGYFAAPLAPMAEEPLLGPGKPLRFRAPGGAEIEARRPLLKAALLVLGRAWPGGLSAKELIAAGMMALRERGLLEAAAIDEAEIDRTVDDLMELCVRRLVEVLPWTPAIERDVQATPALHPLARVEAERTGVVTTPRHDPVLLEEPVRTVAVLLDGTRDLRALVNELSSRIDSGELDLGGEWPIASRAARLAEVVKRSVLRLRDLGLLMRGERATLPRSTP